MTNIEAKNKIVHYLKSHFIHHIKDFDDAPRITMTYQYENVPGNVIESSIWFWKETMEVRVYYSEIGATWCKESDHRDDLFRLLNYINARVFPRTSDGTGTLYGTSELYTPRIYMTEDDCFDISLTTIIPYDFYELAQLETEDYITACCPELLSKLAFPIFGVLDGKLNVETAIEIIRKEV